MMGSIIPQIVGNAHNKTVVGESPMTISLFTSFLVVAIPTPLR